MHYLEYLIWQGLLGLGTFALGWFIADVLFPDLGRWIDDVLKIKRP
jgi:hypothetical protein